jgi:hypothetical protein
MMQGNLQSFLIALHPASCILDRPRLYCESCLC